MGQPRKKHQERDLQGHGEWLTADETVIYLGLPSRKALYQATRRGQVPVHRLGRRLRYRRGELDAILAAS